MNFPPITRTTARPTVNVTFPDGRVYEGPKDTPLEAFVRQADDDAGVPAPLHTLAVKIENRLRELTLPVTHDMQVIPLNYEHRDGALIYRRSLCFLLAAAVQRCFPEERLVVEHAVALRSYFCRLQGSRCLTAEELDQVKQTMQALVTENLPIERSEMELDEARHFFEQRGDQDKVRLLRYRTRPTPEHLCHWRFRGLLFWL
ncbi:MAG: hypothetical protein HC915_12640 [Anaerolineae bacterium]|nr:hypothetical protein [Anaerolineae bacterium]